MIDNGISTGAWPIRGSSSLPTAYPGPTKHLAHRCADLGLRAGPKPSLEDDSRTPREPAARRVQHHGTLRGGGIRLGARTRPAPPSRRSSVLAAYSVAPALRSPGPAARTHHRPTLYRALRTPIEPRGCQPAPVRGQAESPSIVGGLELRNADDRPGARGPDGSRPRRPTVLTSPGFAHRIERFPQALSSGQTKKARR